MNRPRPLLAEHDAAEGTVGPIVSTIVVIAILLAGAGVALGRDYPRPVVDFRASREAALAAYAAITGPAAPTRPARG